MNDESEAHNGRRTSRSGRGGWRSRFWITGFFAALTVVAADRVAGAFAPPRGLREVEDAIRELRRGADPTVLVIGSSHARTFAVLDDSLRARTAGEERILAVPVEWGKLSSYRWVLENRLLPFFDGRAPGTPPGPSVLRRAIIVTEWWDSCPGDPMPRNLPARSWTWQDYLADVRTNGLTSYNDNFLAYRWSRWFRASALVQDRGHGRLLSAVRQRIAPSSAEASQARFDETAREWQRMVESGVGCLGAPSEMDALNAMVDTLLGRRLDVTVLLYPRMPVTLTETAKATTLPLFAARVRELVEPRGVRVVDLTSNTPLRDDEFGGDFDHVLPEGNARFSGWALDGPLRFMAESRR